MEESPNYYGILPASVRYCKKLNPHAKILYTELSALTNKNGYCHATNAYFAKLYEVSERAITKWFKELSEFGFIEIQIIRNQSGTFRRIVLSGVNSRSIGGMNSGSTPPEQPFYTKEYYEEEYTSMNNTSNNKESVSVSESEIESVKYYFETNQILELLTEKTGAKYKIPKTKSLLLRYGVYKLIKERFEDGAILEDFVNIIEYKYNEWINTKFISYLVPDTLFRKSNFEKYLTQIQIKPISNNTNNLIDDNGNYAKTDEGRKLFHANVAKGAADAIRAIRNGERDDFWLRISNAKPE
jgi:uncharacterized phage protein (TIGR02220 family)